MAIDYFLVFDRRPDSAWTFASWQSATRICKAHGMPLRGSAPEPETAE